MRPGSPGGMKRLGQRSLTSMGISVPRGSADDCQPQGRWERGWEDMAHPGARRIHVVRTTKPKRLTGLDHKGTWPGGGVSPSPPAEVAPPAERRSRTHPWYACGTWDARLSPLGKARRRASREGGGSGMPEEANAILEWGGEGWSTGHITPRESGLTS